MIDISLEVNGRKVSPNNMGNAIENHRKIYAYLLAEYTTKIVIPDAAPASVLPQTQDRTIFQHQLHIPRQGRLLIVIDCRNFNK